MEVDSGLFLFFALFQFGGASILALQRLDGKRGPPVLLAGLLVLNGVLTTVSFLGSVGAGISTEHPAYLIVDAPTGALLLAYVALRNGKRGWANAAFGLGAATVALGVIDSRFITEGLSRVLLVPGVYYAGLTLVVLTSARGRAIDQWIALAFAPRALLFVTQAIPRGLDFGSIELEGRLLMPITLAMGAACILALVEIVRRPLPGGPTLPLVVALAVIGPADAIAWRFVDGTTPRGAFASAVLNYLTLSLVRPLFLYVAFAADEVPRLLARCLFAAGAGFMLVLLGPSIGFPAPTVGILAISVGSLVLAADEARRTRTTAAQVEEPSRPARPQWQTLLVALHDAGAQAPGAAPREAWTQRGLARTTGISVQRVSEFADEINEGAEDRLDALLPAWREGSYPARTLVTKHQGAVAGLRGPRVYYRLTPLGARLAERLKTESAFTLRP